MAKNVASALLLTLTLVALLMSHSIACPYCPTPNPPSPPPPVPCPPPPVPVQPPPKPACPPPPVPVPTPSCPSCAPPTGRCPVDVVKLDACVDILGGLVHVGVGSEATDACCPVLAGVADLDAALCLCTCIKARVLGISVVLPIALEVLVGCGKHVPSDYQCPN